MKTFHDPIQAIAAGASGILARSLLAGITMLLGTAVVSFPDVDFQYAYQHAFRLLLPPIWIFLGGPVFPIVLACVCFGTVWISFCAYIRLDCGKWTLFTLFTSSLCLIILGDYSHLNYHYWHNLWEVYHWPLTLPFMAGLTLAVPDLINYCLRKHAIKSVAPETTVTSNPVAPLHSPSDHTEP